METAKRVISKRGEQMKKEEQLKILSRLIRDRWEAIGYSHADYVFNQETQTTETVQTEETTE